MTSHRFAFHQGENGAALAVHVIPGAKKDEFAGKFGDAIKIRLTAPPVEGKANKALLNFLAKKLKVKKSQLEIVAGESSRDKLVAVIGLSPEEVDKALASHE
jgi:uncharacterized protein